MLYNVYMKTLKAFRLSEEAITVLDKQDNATQFLEDLILSKAQTISKGEAMILDKLNSLGTQKVELVTTNAGTPSERSQYVEVPKPFVPSPPDPETGYPCCQKEIRCKHWVWDVNKALYVNSLTGAEKEADV